MPKKIVSFVLSEKLAKRLEKTSKALGMSRSELVELLLKKGFHFSTEIQEDVEEISKQQEEMKKKIKHKEY